jgi:adenylosuccinate synthase
MTRSAIAVVGANYGDEGKGLMTDYHAAASGKDGIVVRFNGGAQAGHTVRTPSGTTHVFSHLGSGTLAGAATYLSRHFACHPMLFLKEVAALKAAGLALLPPVFVDPEAPVSTPYDVLINQAIERQREVCRHGSCGMGFGETIERGLAAGFTLTVADLHHGAAYLLHRLAAIRDDYVPRRLAELGITALDDKAAGWLASDALMQRFAHDAMQFRRAIHCTAPGMLVDYAQVIFEGAQGLLLDQDRGNFPWVTRSHTGIRNALDVAAQAGIDALHVIYVSRAYITRHGAGPLPNELPCKPYAGISDATNVPNEFQGALRFAHLDLDLMEQSIHTDFDDARLFPGVTCTLNLALSCLDQVGQAVFYFEDGTHESAPPAILASDLGRRLNAGVVYTTWGATRDTVRLL